MNQTAKEEHRQDMFSLIKKFEESNTSAREFYRQHNLPAHIFYYWRRKYREAHSPTKQGFLPVEIGPPVFSLTSSFLYYLYREPTDMRKSFDGLSGIVQGQLDRSPTGKNEQ